MSWNDSSNSCPLRRPALGSPLAVLQAMRALPDLEAGDVDELERMIESAKLPTCPEGLFDNQNA